MFLRLLLLFTLVPLVELALLVTIGRHLGLAATLLLVLATGVLGAWLAKSQGLRALVRVRTELGSGRMPTEALLDGVLIFVAGAVLLTPGLLTDAAGFFLLSPKGRAWVRRAATVRLHRYMKRSTGQVTPRVIVIEPDRDP